MQSCRSSAEITPPRSHFTHELQVRAAHRWEAKRLSAIPSTAVVEDQEDTNIHLLQSKEQPEPHLPAPHLEHPASRHKSQLSITPCSGSYWSSFTTHLCSKLPHGQGYKPSAGQEDQPAGASLLVLQSCPSCITHTSAPRAALLCSSEHFPLFFQQIPLRGKSSAFDTEAFQSIVFFSLR